MPNISSLMKVNQYGELFPPGVKCLGHEAEHSPSPILRLRMRAGFPALPYMHSWHAELQIFSLYDSD